MLSETASPSAGAAPTFCHQQVTLNEPPAGTPEALNLTCNNFGLNALSKAEACRTTQTVSANKTVGRWIRTRFFMGFISELWNVEDKWDVCDLGRNGAHPYVPCVSYVAFHSAPTGHAATQRSSARPMATSISALKGAFTATSKPRLPKARPG